MVVVTTHAIRNDAMTLRMSPLQVAYSARGIPTYRCELWHDGLKKHRIITSNDRSVVQRKCQLQAADWEDRWRVLQTRKLQQQEKARQREHRDSQKSRAAQLSADAKREIETAQSILAHTLGIDDTIDWDQLKDSRKFPEPKPTRSAPPAAPPSEPVKEHFHPRTRFIDRLVPFRVTKILKKAMQAYDAAVEQWRRDLALFIEQEQRQQSDLDARINQWERRLKDFLTRQAELNAAIERKRLAYEAKNPDAIIDYCDLVLSNSHYPEWIPKEWEIDYDSETRRLVVEYSFPSPSHIPRLVEVKYNQA